MNIIGLAGTNGSGKDSVGAVLAEQHNYLFISVTEMLRSEATKRGLDVERSVLRSISAEWRRANGLGVLIDKAIERYTAEGGDNKYGGLAVSSIRNPGEADRIHELGGHMLWVDADPQIRYQRAYNRKRTSEDDKTFEQFLAEEAAEMNASGDEATLSMASVKAKSDIIIENNGSSLDILATEVEKKLARIL